MTRPELPEEESLLEKIAREAQHDHEPLTQAEQRRAEIAFKQARRLSQLLVEADPLIRNEKGDSVALEYIHLSIAMRWLYPGMREGIANEMERQRQAQLRAEIEEMERQQEERRIARQQERTKNSSKKSNKRRLD